MAVAADARRVGTLGLEARVETARDAAVERLVDLRTPERIWRERFDLCAMTGAAYIAMVRTSGLIDQPRTRRDEALVARHVVHQANPDGGFWGYPGSRSSPGLTRLAITALRAVLGLIEAGARPPQWWARNPEVDASLARAIKRTVEAGELYFARQERTPRWLHEPWVALPAALLADLIDPGAGRRPGLPVWPAVVAAADHQPLVRWARDQTSALANRIAPALSILHRRARQPARGERSRSAHPRASAPVMRLVGSILSRQNANGDWFYCVPYTLLNVMALIEAGIPSSHTAIQRAHGFVRNRFFGAPDGGLAISAINSDVWDTSVAAASYLSAPGRTAMDEDIRPAIEFLLDGQGPHGGYGWGSGAHHDPDCDSTAAVVRALMTASRTATPELAGRIDCAVQRCIDAILSRQNTRGGFGVWSKSLAGGGRGPVGPLRGFLLDEPSADLNGRMVAALTTAGPNPDGRAVRRGTRAIVRMQARSGGWWCRWWAGYIPGTAFVLDGLGRAGLRYRDGSREGDQVRRQASAAVDRGVHFLLGHQNRDGGWGETTAADWDDRLAGVGESLPLQTAVALLGLAAVRYPMASPAVRRAVGYLLDEQRAEGLWHDDQATFTILPRVCYYRHPLYAASVIPLALSVYLKTLRA